MKKIWLFLLCVSSIWMVHASDEWIECSEKGFKGHLQGIAADESGIYWAFYDTLLKTDYQGKKIASVPRIAHMGDLCVANGKVFVTLTVYGKKHLPKHDNWSGWVLEFDSSTLKYLARHKMEAPRVDGITCLDGKFFVGIDAGRAPHPKNEILIYDRNFKFLKKVTVDIGGTTMYGVQTMNPYQGKLLTSFYADRKKKSYLFDIQDFSKVAGIFPERTSFGMAAVPASLAGAENVFLIAHNTGTKKNWSAKLRVVRMVDGKLTPYKMPVVTGSK